MNKKDEYQPLTHFSIPKSQGTPTCAIYALLNGLYADTEYKPSPHQFRKLTEKIWEMAVKSDSIPGENIDADDLEYSLVGEFFDSKALREFIKVNKQDINELLDGYEIMDADNPGFGGSLITKLKNVSANELYLIPIDVNSSKGKNNIHWIFFKKLRDDRLAIFNSNPKAEKIALSNSGIEHHNGKPRIEYLGELVEVYEEMLSFHNSDKGRIFDFRDWAKLKHRHRSYPKEVNTVIKKLKKEPCNYSFSKSDLDIIKVTYKEKQ